MTGILLWLLLILVPMLLGLWAQFKVMGTYRKWVEVPSRSRISGREAAAYVMRSAGVTDVRIIEVPGQLTDHYNPQTRELALSHDNYHGTSLAALGVAAHEAGHAIQHKVGDKAMELRQSLVPAASFASGLLPLVLIGGMFAAFFANLPGIGLTVVVLAIVGYLILTLFQLVTLPVEFDASNRAKAQLATLGIIDRDEAVGVRETLDAAAWTYVAAFIASLGTLLWYIFQLISMTQSREE